MNEMQRITPSGVTIPESDVKAIEKETRKDTLKTVFAVIGVGAAFVFVRGWLATQRDNSSSDD